MKSTSSARKINRGVSLAFRVVKILPGSRYIIHHRRRLRSLVVPRDCYFTIINVIHHYKGWPVLIRYLIIIKIYF